MSVDPQADLNVTTQVLYGILASQRSYEIGVRCLVKAEHAKMLAIKIAGHHLPQELVDNVAEHLTELGQKDVRRFWNKKLLFRPATTIRTPAERMVERTLSRSNVSIVRVGITPHQVTLQDGGRAVRQYLHLSAATHRPSIYIAVPNPPHSKRQSIRRSGQIMYSISNGMVDVSCRKEQSVLPSTVNGMDLMNADNMAYRAEDQQESDESVSCNTVSGTVMRLLNVADLENTVRGWDSKAVEQCIDMLNLHVVHTEGEERLKPTLRIVQTVSKC